MSFVVEEARCRASGFERIGPLGGREGFPCGFPSNNRLESVEAAQNFREAKCRQSRPFPTERSPSADAGCPGDTAAPVLVIPYGSGIDRP